MLAQQDLNSASRRTPDPDRLRSRHKGPLSQFSRSLLSRYQNSFDARSRQQHCVVAFDMFDGLQMICQSAVLTLIHFIAIIVGRKLKMPNAHPVPGVYKSHNEISITNSISFFAIFPRFSLNSDFMYVVA